MSKKDRLESIVQREIELELGAEPDLLLLRNSVGKATYCTDSGDQYHVPYGLGVGSPDLVGMRRTNRGNPIASWFCLEVKRPGQKATDEQLAVHTLWRRFGAFVAVVTSAAEARAALERARQGESQ
jgi:hypothetical protein